MKVQDILSWLDKLAPFETAEGFDNVGLLIGDTDATVCGVLFGMDVTEALVQEAIVRGANVIISHHPFIFHALKRIDYTGPQGRALCRLTEARISVIAAHTNWDKAIGGISDSLASVLGLTAVSAPDDYLRIGTLSTPLSPDAFARTIGARLHLMPRVYQASDRLLSRIAVAGGAYGEGYELASAMGADAFIVGEIAHHELVDAFARGLSVYDAGHFATEWPGVKALFERFLADMPSQSGAAWLHHAQAPYVGALPAF